jgi:hypothetical protein
MRASTPCGLALAHSGDDVAVALDEFGESEVAQVRLVVRRRGSDDGRSLVPDQLDGDASDAAGGTTSTVSPACGGSDGVAQS